MRCRGSPLSLMAARPRSLRSRVGRPIREITGHLPAGIGNEAIRPGVLTRQAASSRPHLPLTAWTALARQHARLSCAAKTPFVTVSHARRPGRLASQLKIISVKVACVCTGLRPLSGPAACATPPPPTPPNDHELLNDFAGPCLSAVRPRHGGTMSATSWSAGLQQPSYHDLQLDYQVGQFGPRHWRD
jgi:hypothetical protein